MGIGCWGGTLTPLSGEGAAGIVTTSTSNLWVSIIENTLRVVDNEGDSLEIFLLFTSSNYALDLSEFLPNVVWTRVEEVGVHFTQLLSLGRVRCLNSSPVFWKNLTRSSSQHSRTSMHLSSLSCRCPHRMQRLSEF